MMKELLFARLLDKLGATRALLGLRGAARTPWLPIVTFHRVLGTNQRTPYALDDEVIDAAPEEFERHIRTIRRYFTPIAIDDIVQAMQGRPLPKNPVLVTFDDGYKDNLDIACPILKRNNVHAVFFIATRNITERRTFWWDRINYILKRSTEARIKLTYPAYEDVSLSSPADREATIHRALRIVKTHVGLDLERFLEHLATAACVPWSDSIDRELANQCLMTWDQIRELRALGMDVQSHTRTHRVLQTLDATQLREELQGSKDELEREIDAPVQSISYPVGHRLMDRDDVRTALANAGYKLGFTNATGTHRLRTAGDPYDVSRIGCDYGTSDALFRAKLAAPFIFD